MSEDLPLSGIKVLLIDDSNRAPLIIDFLHT